MSIIIETQEATGNDDAHIVVSYDDTHASVPVMYRFAVDGEPVNRWATTPFQSVNIQRGTVCDLVQNWLDEGVQQHENMDQRTQRHAPQLD